MRASELLAALRSPVLLVTAVVVAGLVLLAEAAGLFGLWLAVVLLAAVARYPYRVLLSAAAGEPEPPPMGLDDFNPLQEPALVAHAMAVALAIAAGVEAGGAGLALSALIGALFPASAALMATSGRLARACNPAAVWSLVRSVGSAYWLLPLWLAASLAATMVLGTSSAVAVGTRFLAIYAVLALFALTGRLLYLRRFDLDLPVGTWRERREAADRVEDNRSWQQRLDEAYALLREGDASRAYAKLHELLADEGYSVASFEALYERLRQWGMHSHTSQIARRFVAVLVARGLLQRAMEVTEERLRHDAGFRPAAGERERIAAYAREVGHDATAALLEARDG